MCTGESQRDSIELSAAHTVIEQPAITSDVTRRPRASATQNMITGVRAPPKEPELWHPAGFE